jgi:hypothetical protein
MNEQIIAATIGMVVALGIVIMSVCGPYKTPSRLKPSPKISK